MHILPMRRDRLVYPAIALSIVRAADPQAVVAGGCLRDTVLDAEIKDIDVFVTEMFDPARIQLEPFDTLTPEIGISMINGYGGGGDHRGPIEGWRLDTFESPYPIQIIRRRFTGMEDILGDMDFGFCQIGYDGEAVWVTEAFLKDVATNTATLMVVDDPERMERSRRRADRLQRKYPTRFFDMPLGL